MRFGPILDPSVLVLLYAHYAVVVQSSEMYLFCLIVRFSNMGTEWGGYHLHLLFESLLYPPLFATLMSLTMLMGDAQFASVSSEKGLVW